MSIKETYFKSQEVKRTVEHAEEMGYDPASCCALAAMCAIQPTNIIPLFIGDNGDEQGNFECDDFGWIDWQDTDEEYNVTSIAIAVREWVEKHESDDFFHTGAKCEVHPLFVSYRTYYQEQSDDEEYFTLHYDIISDVFNDGEWAAVTKYVDITERVQELMNE